MASIWENITMAIIPGMNKCRRVFSSSPEPNKVLSQEPQNRMSRIKINVIVALMSKEEEAMTVRWWVSWVPVTYRIWAFLRSPTFVVSNTVVTTVNKAQIPMLEGSICLARIIRLKKPNRVMESLCETVKNADLIQYEEK
jgi:hypothetical protein